MKLNSSSYILVLFFSVFITISINAQERPEYIIVTTAHANLDKNKSIDDWKASEKIYFEKVTNKNEFINNSTVLVHYFTADNSEIKFVSGYTSWENIEKASKRSGELEKEAWPNEADRETYFKERSGYYTPMHSDEIYSTLDGAKMFSEKPTEPMVYYVRVSHTAWPDGGSMDEITALAKEFNENVTQKNKYVKGYFPSRHAWGADSRDLVEAFAVESLGDVANALEENEKLIKDHWPDEAKRKEFFSKMDAYMSGTHGDFIFNHVPELSK
jgi:hypothetical protein